MKFIGKLLVYLLVALLIVVLALYFLLQTRWGVSGQQLGNGEYRLRTQFRQDGSPLFVTFPHHSGKRHLWPGRQTRHAGCQKVDIGLSSRQITDPLHMDTITLFDGTLNLSANGAAALPGGSPAAEQHGL
jgi:hypothetical protein